MVYYQSNEGIPPDDGEPPPSPFCVFCYKEVRKDPSSAHAHHPPQHKNNKFGSLARFLGLKVISSSVISSCAADSFKLCSDCEPLLDKVADLCGNLRRVELELEWKIGMIKDIMVAADADRVPSRLAFAKGHYSEMVKKEAVMVVGQVEEWRRKLVKKCTLKLKASLPKVKLHKLDGGNSSAASLINNGDTESVTPNYRRTRTPSQNPLVPATAKQIKSEESAAEPIILVYSRKAAAIREGEPAPPLHDEPQDTSDRSKFPRRKFPCSTCKLPFSTSSALRQHVKSHHGGGSSKVDVSQVVYECDRDQCSAYFLLPIQLERHRELFHDEERRAKGLTEGRWSKRRGRPCRPLSPEKLQYKYNCSVCPARFTQKPNLNAHFKSHHDRQRGTEEEEIFKCSQDGCSAYFRVPAQLQRHLKACHQNNDDHGSDNMSSICHSDDENGDDDAESNGKKTKQLESMGLVLKEEPKVDESEECHLKEKAVLGVLTTPARTTGNVTSEGLEEEIANNSLNADEDDDIRSTAADDGWEDDELQVMEDPLMEVTTTTALPQNPIKKKLADNECQQEDYDKHNVKKWERMGGGSQHQAIMRVQHHQCRVCKSSCAHSSSLRRHYREQHGVRIRDAVRCVVGGCSAYFRTQMQLHRHKATHHTTYLTQYDQKDELELKFPSCKAEEEVKKRRKSSGHKPPPRESQTVTRKPGRRGRRISIIMAAPRPNPQNTTGGRRPPPDENRKRCKTCGKEFTTVSHLRRHRYTVHREEVDLKFTCEVAGCGRKFESAGEAKFHVSLWHKRRTEKLKHRIKSYDVSIGGGVRTCELCGMFIRDTCHWKRHLKRHSGPDSWEFECSTCGRKCISKKDLERHMSTHTGEAACMCQYCGKVLSCKSYLKLHTARRHRYQVEGGEREPEPGLKFTCEVAGCGKIFDSATGLNRHTGIVHKGTTGHANHHVCELCGKSIRSKSYLNQHLKLHRGQLARRPAPPNKFECSTCGYKCPSNRRLAEHMRSHTGERPFSCQDCGATFTREDSLKDHRTKKKKPCVLKK